MDENMILENEIENSIEEWSHELMNEHNVSDEEDLTLKQLKTELEEIKGTIANEMLWDVDNNVEIYTAYKEYLEELIEIKEESL